MGLRVSGLGFRVGGLGFGAWGLGFGVGVRVRDAAWKLSRCLFFRRAVVAQAYTPELLQAPSSFSVKLPVRPLSAGGTHDLDTTTLHPQHCELEKQ